ASASARGDPPTPGVHARAGAHAVRSTCAAPGPLRGPANEERATSRWAPRYASLPALPNASAAAARSRRKRRARSPAVTLLTNQLRGRDRERNRLARAEARQPLLTRRELRRALQVREQIVGERHACERCPRLENAMHLGGNIADLNHDA